MSGNTSTGPEWRKSRRSGGSGSCVEIASVLDEHRVRDSKDPEGPVLRFDRTGWRSFVRGAAEGLFDVP